MVIDIFNDIKQPSFDSKRTPMVTRDNSALDTNYDDNRSDVSTNRDGKEQQNGVYLGSVTISGKNLMNLLLSRKVNTQWFDIEKDITTDDIEEDKVIDLPIPSSSSQVLTASRDLLSLAMVGDMQGVEGGDTKAKKIGKFISGEIRISGTWLCAFIICIFIHILMSMNICINIILYT
jgi:hypothetical protein